MGKTGKKKARDYLGAWNRLRRSLKCSEVGVVALVDIYMRQLLTLTGLTFPEKYEPVP